MLGLSINSASHAESQKELHNPTPSRGESGKPEQKNPSTSNKDPQQDERGTESRPFVVKGIPTEKTQQEAADDREERNKKALLDLDLNLYTGLQAIFTVVLAVVAILQIVLFWDQLSLMRGALNASKSAADAALEQAKAITQSERAYVKMSHYPPGLVQTPRSSGHEVRLQIKNFGNTPANVTRVVLDYKIIPHGEPLPAIPDFTHQKEIRMASFLIREDEISDWYQIPLVADEVRCIKSESKGVLFIYGYIDYVDQFNSRYRAGYGRRYDPVQDDRPEDMTDDRYNQRNNLLYITDAGYNYDRPQPID